MQMTEERERKENMENNKQNTSEMENPLVFREKPYYTDEEQELYYRIAIDEFMKNGHPEMAAHYQILLRTLLNKDKEMDPLTKMIIEHNRNKD